MGGDLSNLFMAITYLVKLGIGHLNDKSSSSHPKNFLRCQQHRRLTTNLQDMHELGILFTANNLVQGSCGSDSNFQNYFVDTVNRFHLTDRFEQERLGEEGQANRDQLPVDLVNVDLHVQTTCATR